jgi:asparagine synthase (glutamine-hydrolysing)
MCGLFGIVWVGNQMPRRDVFDRGLNRLRHRGPDFVGVTWEPTYGVALGHTRLSIIDPSELSNQPYETDACTIAFNGEIYNYQTLRGELIVEGDKFSSNGDAEVIARGYERWGVGVFRRLHGMFAVAILDKRSGDIHLSRDLFGIKPLYLCKNEAGLLLFSSEVKPLEEFGKMELNIDTLLDLCTWGFPLSLDAIYTGVSQLTPGAIATIRRCADGIALFVDDGEPLRALYRQPPSSSAMRELSGVLAATVKDHLIADVPVAVALSGGLDSSIVAAIAARERANLTAFTLTLSNQTDPEVQYARIVCKQLNLRHEVVSIEVRNLEALFEQVAFYLEEPIANINVLTSYALGAAASANGFKVILMGDGSDELFAGYPWYALCRDPGISGDPVKLFDAYRKRRMRSGFNHYLRANVLENMKYRLDAQARIFAAHFASTESSCLNRFLHFDQAFQLQFSQLLRVDRMTMAHGVEARVPFLYEPLASLSARLHDSRKIRLHWYQWFGREGKIALGNVASGLLPRQVANRPKFGASGTVNLWKTALVSGLDTLFHRILEANCYHQPREVLAEYIDWKALQENSIPAKDKFFLSMLVMCVGVHICGEQYQRGEHALTFR